MVRQIEVCGKSGFYCNKIYHAGKTCKLVQPVFQLIQSLLFSLVTCALGATTTTAIVLAWPPPISENHGGLYHWSAAIRHNGWSSSRRDLYDNKAITTTAITILLCWIFHLGSSCTPHMYLPIHCGTLAQLVCQTYSFILLAGTLLHTCQKIKVNNSPAPYYSIVHGIITVLKHALWAYWPGYSITGN